MIRGHLRYNERNDRYGIRQLYEQDWEHNGLSCGEPLEVFDGEDWIPTRIEMDGNGTYYLVGIDGAEGDELTGLTVRQSW